MEEVPVTDPMPERGVDGRRVVVAAVVVVAAIAAYFALGMPGMGHGGGTGTMEPMDASTMDVGVEEFATRIASSDSFVVNVHVPDEGTIGETDAAIPYRDIVGDDRLPEDRSAPILLYCKTGRMSAEAATALMGAGYTDVVHLDGGMDAWVAAGRSLR